MISMDVTSLGPLFDGRAAIEMKQGTKEVERQLAEEGKRIVDQNLATSLQNPTGYYQSQIHIASDLGGTVVTDGGVIYGPWLEGVGSRNRTTRFKGYFAFRRALQELSSRAETKAEEVIDPYIRRIE